MEGQFLRGHHLILRDFADAFEERERDLLRNRDFRLHPQNPAQVHVLEAEVICGRVAIL